MIDTLLAIDGQTITTGLKIRNENIFCENGVLAAYGLIENMAQTCAARLGYINYVSRKVVQIGYIGAVRNCRILRRPHNGETIVTRATVLEEIFGLALVGISVLCGDEILATAQMKIAIGEEGRSK